MAVKRHAAVSVVILHDGDDWETRPAFAMHITNGDMIGTRSAHTMDYLALALATKIQLHSQGTRICSDSQAVVKIIRRHNEHLNKRDCSHRFLLQSIDSSIRKGAKEAHWIPSHAERRKTNWRTWTRDDWGNHLADKVVEGNRQHVATKLLHLQWTAVDAITAISTLPEEGELYIGDWASQPKALHGIIDAGHTVRHERYVVNRNTTSGAG